MVTRPSDPVRGLVHRHAVFVSPATSLRGVAAVLYGHSCGVALVGDETHCEGVISERDIVAEIAKGTDLDSCPAKQAMTAYVISAHEDDPVFDVASQMLDDEMRHMPVADEHERIIGVVSLRDVIDPLLIAALSGKETR